MDTKDLIKNRRLEIGITMKELADKIGVSEGTISRWESGDISNMRRDKICMLSKALSISPMTLIDCEEHAEKVEVKQPYISEFDHALVNAYHAASEERQAIIRDMLHLNEDSKAKIG